MYKWIWNFLRITGNPERIKELKERANLNGRVFNFEAFVPVDREDPRFLDYDDKFEQEDWCLEYWGTEQNAKDAKIKEDEPDSIFYAFKTACRSFDKKGDKDCPAGVARALKDLYLDLDIYWSCQGIWEWSNFDIDFDYYDENGGLLDTFEDPREEFRNCVTMDEANVEKFKKLYDKNGEWNWFSLAMIIPEPVNESEEWTDCTMQVALRYPSLYNEFQENPRYLANDIGSAIAAWRYENWGTPSEAMYDMEDVFSDNIGIHPKIILPKQLANKMFRFYTLSFPPLKIYQKMAADGLVFKAKWESDGDGRWAKGEGQVIDGYFRYEPELITGYEKKLINDYFNWAGYRKSIVVKNRKHLDQLIEFIRNGLCDSLLNEDVFFEKPFTAFWKRDDLSHIDGDLFQLNKTLDLNFLDVSRVTDMSGLFKDFKVFIVWRGILRKDTKKYRCKIKIDISQWDVSNVTKMAHMFDGCENVDFGDLSKWDRSKVADC